MPSHPYSRNSKGQSQVKPRTLPGFRKPDLIWDVGFPIYETSVDIFVPSSIYTVEAQKKHVTDTPAIWNYSQHLSIAVMMFALMREIIIKLMTRMLKERNAKAQHAKEEEWKWRITP
jgi:hypothetical protein